mmetsp:Transcript_13170/g.20488  ORF Transcript_13170/g.20488 Transcript_13170/m.20488 type:complete len:249 (-) Transcript_13170:31-777(-)
MQVGVGSLLLFVEAAHGLLQVVLARALGNEGVRFVPVVVASPLEKRRLEFLFVDLTRLHAHFDEHLDYALNVGLFDAFAVTLPFNLREQQGDQPLFDVAFVNDVVLELVGLHVVHIGQVLLLCHERLVQVQQDVSDLLHYVLLHLPHVGDLAQQRVVGHLVAQPVGDGQQHICSGFLDVVVEHLPVLVERQNVRRSVEFFVGQRRSLVIVNLLDGIPQHAPALHGLLAVADLVSVVARSVDVPTCRTA